MTIAPALLRSVTVSIVIHNQWELAWPLIRQLDQFCHSSIAKVVLTVNMPEAISLDPAWRFPVECIFNESPRGFGSNHNTAFECNESPWFLVLNPDIRLTDDTITALLGHAQRNTGLLAPRIHEPNKSEPEPYRRLLSPLELLKRRLPSHRPPERPEWVAGMFMLIRRLAYGELKGFDERFFMYCEDFDLCARLEINGWRLAVAEQLVVLHDARRDSHRSLLPLAWHMRSLMQTWTSAAFWRYWYSLRCSKNLP